MVVILTMIAWRRVQLPKRQQDPFRDEEWRLGFLYRTGMCLVAICIESWTDARAEKGGSCVDGTSSGNVSRTLGREILVDRVSTSRYCHRSWLFNVPSSTFNVHVPAGTSNTLTSSISPSLHGTRFPKYFITVFFLNHSSHILSITPFIHSSSALATVNLPIAHTIPAEPNTTYILQPFLISISSSFSPSGGRGVNRRHRSGNKRGGRVP